MDYQHTSKDRSLGFVEMKVRDLIGDGPDKETEPYSSTGKKSHRDALKQPKGGYKGTIEFDAQFVPCAWMPNIEFVDPEAERIAEEKAEDKAETGSIASTASTVSESEIADAVLTHNGPAGADADEAKPKAAPALSRETILKSQSGIIAVQIISGKLARKGARLEILYDDGYWPSYSSEPARSQQTTFDEIGEAFIRELDYSQIIFKLNMAEKETQEDMIGAAVMDMNEFLENTLDKRFTIPLTGSAGRSTVVVSSKYIPVDIEIEPQESVNNMGFLRVDLLDGKDLPGADRSGKSDPYAVFELNGEKVHKSEVVKKTLSPKWNENFTTQIRSRVADKLTLEVFDWDRIGSATLLGNAVIDLQSLEPFESKEVEVPLTSAKTHGQQGHVNLRLLFRPQFLARERTATSAFGAAGRVATGLGQGVGAVGGAAIHGVGAVGGGVVHGVGTVGGGVVQGVGAVGGGVIGAGESLHAPPHCCWLLTLPRRWHGLGCRSKGRHWRRQGRAGCWQRRFWHRAQGDRPSLDRLDDRAGLWQRCRGCRRLSRGRRQGRARLTHGQNWADEWRGRARREALHRRAQQRQDGRHDVGAQWRDGLVQRELLGQDDV